MFQITRRMLLQSLPAIPLVRGAKPEPTVGLSFTTYGMKSLTPEAAARAIAGVGYDGIGFALMPGWPTEPKLLSPSDRRELRKQLADLHLGVSNLAESLPLISPPEKRVETLDRLKRAVALAHDVSPHSLPVIQTALFGKSADWENEKASMVEALREWAKIAQDGKITICFEIHAGHAAEKPERALWLIKETGSPHIRAIYDYSHFYVQGLPLSGTLRELAPMTRLVQLKDGVAHDGTNEYLLPGDGKTDYGEYFKTLKETGYSGFAVVLVSGSIHRKPDYQPVPIARLCYQRMSDAMAKAGIKRPARGV
jgi:sugar phosphate isomerase/epimerase